LSKALLDTPPTIPAGKRKLRAFHPSVRGLFAELRPSGVATFYLKYRDARGRTREFKVGRYGDITWEQALRRAQELRAKVTLGGDPAAELAGLRAVPTVKEFVENSYLPYVRDRLRSYKNLKSMADKKIIPAFGNKGLDEVTPQDVQTFRRDLAAEGMSNAYVNRHLTLLRRMFTLACDWQLLNGRNPASKPGLLPERHRELYLDHAQLRALLVALGNDQDIVASALIAFLALTGARRGEAMQARWEHIDPDRAQWTVPLSKSGHARHIPLSDTALELLGRLPREAGNPFVFVGRKDGTHITEVRSAWVRAKTVAGIPQNVRLHDLRHSFASTLVNRGTPLLVICKILGHRQLATTTRYAHLDQDNLLAAATAVGKIALGQDAD
jgi:integrase